ncbi:MAG TPA: anaerobic ribonucleoside-triphosphate reductase, partial [Saccharospirillum sp.]|nr:anaerobic ribonucleoside-triphosphate reductase [Saccharospirillum sp.]
KAGCNYFCINVRITICNECENIDKRTLYHCPSCQSKNVDHATRVIGYLKRVSAFSAGRRKEHRLRHYHRSSAQTA